MPIVNENLVCRVCLHLDSSNSDPSPFISDIFSTTRHIDMTSVDLFGVKVSDHDRLVV